MEDIAIIEVLPQKVLGIRKQGKYEIIVQLISTVYEYAISQGAEFAGPPLFVCHEITVEDAMKAQQDGTADVEIAVPIKNNIEETEDIKCYELPGGMMAKTMHHGPYEECQPTYERFYQWIEDHGKKITGPVREVYLNDPHEVEKEDILTEIYAPVS